MKWIIIEFSKREMEGGRVYALIPKIFQTLDFGVNTTIPCRNCIKLNLSYDAFIRQVPLLNSDKASLHWPRSLGFKSSLYLGLQSILKKGKKL